MAAVDPEDEAFRTVVAAAVRGVARGDAFAVDAIGTIMDAARAWAEDKASTRFFEGRDQGWVDGQQAERDSHTCERD